VCFELPNICRATSTTLVANPHRNPTRCVLITCQGTNYGEGNTDFETPYMMEAFDMDADPWQMNNVFMSLNESLKASLHADVHAWHSCKGASCP
jgi:hypothetical protein